MIVLAPSLLLQLPHRPERSDRQHRAHDENKHRHSRKEAAGDIGAVDLALEALVTFAFVHLLALLTDGVAVRFLQLDKVEGHAGNVAQRYQGIEQSLPQQHGGPPVRYPEHPQSERGAGVDHQEPATDHSEDIRGPLQLMEEAVQLHHPVGVGSCEGAGPPKVVVVDAAQAGQVTVAAVVAVRHASADGDQQVDKELHELAETWQRWSHHGSWNTGRR